MRRAHEEAGHGLAGAVLDGRFQVNRVVGRGSFGDVYSGVDLWTNLAVAIKVDNKPSSHNVPSSLEREAEIYPLIQGGVGVPHFVATMFSAHSRVLVMELLGPSLQTLLIQCGGRFSLKTVLMLADQMIARVQHVHSRGFLHRDIKPDNFAIGRAHTCAVVFLLDFGLCKRFVDPESGEHIARSSGKSLTGTARYASVRNHQGKEQSRRDDLESIGYVLLYLLRGSLPWQGVRGANKQEKYERIGQIKQATAVAELCRGAPTEFVTFLEYCRSLTFRARPDYHFLRCLFSELFYDMGFTYDNRFDWTVERG